MRERLPCLSVTNEERRDLIVEERAGDSSRAVTNMDASWSALIGAFVQVALEVRRTVLVGANLERDKRSSIPDVKLT